MAKPTKVSFSTHTVWPGHSFPVRLLMIGHRNGGQGESETLVPPDMRKRLSPHLSLG